MKSFLATFFNRENKKRGDYNGLSDFMIHASSIEKKQLFIEAAQKANEDQYKVYKSVEHRIKST